MTNKLPHPIPLPGGEGKNGERVREVFGKNRRRCMKKTREQKRRVVELMTLGGLSPTEAARAAGVPLPTVRSWFQDEEFRKEVEAWKAGPGMDEATVAQARRILVDELARRVLHERGKMSLRELLTVQDRLTQETSQTNKEKHDEEEEAGGKAGDIELTPEQVERVWAEIDRGVGGAEEGAAPHETKS
jgi:transposase-like protein